MPLPEENRLAIEELQRQIEELKVKEEPKLEEPKPFKDIEEFDNLKVNKLYANLPVWLSVPTYTAQEGEIVLYDNGTDTRKICAYLGGTWYSIAIT